MHVRLDNADSWISIGNSSDGPEENDSDIDSDDTPQSILDGDKGSATS